MREKKKRQNEGKLKTGGRRNIPEHSSMACPLVCGETQLESPQKPHGSRQKPQKLSTQSSHVHVNLCPCRRSGFVFYVHPSIGGWIC